ncbi:MAG TPA: Lrp/AsnC family transcriptional regulator [candidate division Zixibacteria bacterium]|nr:Lrp/AsnC family transcriptional regulator [candidate division Zixibacteria bacterium]
MLPVSQAEMWKALGISSREGSELIGYLLGDKLIRRTRIKTDGKWTFLLESANGNGHPKKTDYSILLSGDRFSPCCGCEKDCVPASCMQLAEWVISK